MNPPILTAEQLELLSKPHYLALLGAFEEARSVSQIAKSSEFKTTTLHYHVKQMLNADLLSFAGTNGRSKLFKAKHRAYSIPETLKARAAETILEAINIHLDKLMKRLEKTVEAHYEADDWLPEASTLGSNAKKQVSAKLGGFATVINFSELSLTAEAYEELTTTLLQMIKRFAKDHEQIGTKTCNLSFLAFKDEERSDRPRSDHYKYVLG